MANFSALFLQGFLATPKIHAQNSRPELSAFLSNFTFLNQKIIQGDFLLTGGDQENSQDTNVSPFRTGRNPDRIN